MDDSGCSTGSREILRTPRLALRELVPEDLHALHQVLGDSLNMRFYPAAFDLDKTAQWIAWCRERYARDGHCLWAVLACESDGSTGMTRDELIGDCGPIVQSVEGTDEMEVGYHIRRDLQRRGYASEAARACRDWAFDNRPIKRVVSLIRPENTPSACVARNNGMHIHRTITWRDLTHDVWMITREAWSALRAST